MTDQWYNRLSEYLLKEGYVNNPICPCVFIKKITSRFIIIAVYVDDLNIIEIHKEILEATMYLKNKFEIKDLGEPNIVLVYRLSTFKVEHFCINHIILKRP